MKQAKIWGETENIWNGNNVEIHRIAVKKGGFCSIHYHQSKHNLFYVESGKLVVEIHRGHDMIDSTVLTAGEQTSTRPGDRHIFKCIEDCVAFEIYWSELLSNDICRETHGGMIK